MLAHINTGLIKAEGIEQQRKEKIALINKPWLNCWATNGRFCVITDNRAALKGKGGRGWQRRRSALARNELLQQDDVVLLRGMNAFWCTYHKQGRVEFCKGSLSQPPTRSSWPRVTYFMGELLQRHCAKMLVCISQVAHNPQRHWGLTCLPAGLQRSKGQPVNNQRAIVINKDTLQQHPPLNKKMSTSCRMFLWLMDRWPTPTVQSIT